MMVTARVADSGWSATLPKAKPLEARQAKKILGHKRRFTENLSDFEWYRHGPGMPIFMVFDPVVGTTNGRSYPACTGWLLVVKLR